MPRLQRKAPSALICGKRRSSIGRMLDPETFTREHGDTYWRFHTTARQGQFDIAAPAGDGFAPDAAALAALEVALAEIDALVERALPVAEAGWLARYKGELRPREAWSLVRLFADADGRIVLSFNEGTYDVYSLWDVTFSGGEPAGVVQRAWGGQSSG